MGACVPGAWALSVAMLLASHTPNPCGHLTLNPLSIPSDLVTFRLAHDLGDSGFTQTCRGPASKTVQVLPPPRALNCLGVPLEAPGACSLLTHPRSHE
jgi:hypothetical protein